jgi:exopolysaccharide production protein ExoQ
MKSSETISGSTEPAQRPSELQSTLQDMQRIFGSIGLLVILYTSMIGTKFLAKPVVTRDYSYFSYDPGMFTYLLYGLVLFVPAITAAIIPGRLLVRAIPVSIVILLGWAAVSLWWSESQLIGATRLVLAASTLLGTLICVASIGPRRTIEIVGLFLGIVVVLDWIAVLAIPTTVNSPWEIDGDMGWVGVHSHKNSAGAIAALASLYYLSHVLFKPSWSRVGLLFLYAAFLWGTHSRTSIGVAAVVGAVLVMFWLGTKSQLWAQLLRVGLIFTLIAFALTILSSLDVIQSYLSNPRVFNGRGTLWHIGVEYLRDHFWLGSGFGSFWRVGGDGPTLRYSHGWGGFSYAAHNGYLDAFITMGFIGFSLAIVAFVVAPAITILRPESRLPSEYQFVAAAFVFFAILQNLLESTFLVVTSPSYVGWAVGLGLAQFCHARSEFWRLPREQASAES